MLGKMGKVVSAASSISSLFGSFMTHIVLCKLSSPLIPLISSNNVMI